MTIKKAKKHQHNFLIVQKDVLEIKELSWAAKGLWAFLMGKPENWETNVKYLSKHFPEGRDFIRSRLKELQKFKVCKYVIKKNEKGEYSKGEYIIYETPYEEEIEEKTEETNDIQKKIPETDSQGPDSQGPGLQGPANTSPLISNEFKLSIESNKNTYTHSADASLSVSIPEFDFYGENKNCKLSKKEYDKLSKTMTQEELDYWIETIDLSVGQAGGQKAFQKKYKSQAKTHYFIILNWKRRRDEEGKPAGKPKGSSLSNKEYAQKLKENYSVMLRQKYLRVEFSNDYLELIKEGCQAPSVCISYEDKDFKRKLEDQLKRSKVMR